jgi:hypothetical protein
VIEIHAESAKRLAKSDEEGIPAIAVLMNFEGVSPESKAGKILKKGRSKKAVK